MKHLIFDCGGVLVYPSVGDWNVPFGMAAALGARACDLGGERYRQAHRRCARWLDEAQRVPDLPEERRLRLMYLRELDADMGWSLAPDALERLADDFTYNIERYGYYDDAVPWLKRWKQRFSLGILSDAMPSILVFLRDFGLLELFDAAVISTQVGAIKPDPRMYAAILKALDAEPADCLFVDDRPGNLVGAVAAGLRAAQMVRPGTVPEALWDGPIVRDFEALDALIEGGVP